MKEGQTVWLELTLHRGGTTAWVEATVLEIGDFLVRIVLKDGETIRVSPEFLFTEDEYVAKMLAH